MTWIIGFLIGNPMGRMVAKYLLILVAIAIIVWQIYRKGRNDLKAEQAMATVKALKERIDVDYEIRNMSLDARRRELARWMR